MAIVRKIGSKSKLQFEVLSIFEKLGVKPKGVILIKPNLSARPPIVRGENTSFEFATSLAKALLNYSNIERIIFAHSPLLGTVDKIFSFEDLIISSEFNKLKKISKKIELLNLDTIERQRKNFEKYSFLLPELLFDGSIDYYINIGAFKTHMETTVSLTIKNQMGLLTADERKRCHQSGELEERIAALSSIIKPNLNFIDGIWGMEGNGPHHGTTVKANLIIASKDIVEIDAIAATLMGFNYKEIKHLFLAEKNKCGNFPGKIDLNNCKSNIIIFRPARKFEKFGKNMYVLPTDGCSKCITSLNEVGKIIKKEPYKFRKFLQKAYFGNKKIFIVLGNAKNLNIQDEKLICIGACTKNFSLNSGCDNLNLCPPSVSDVIKYLDKLI